MCSIIFGGTVQNDNGSVDMESIIREFIYLFLFYHLQDWQGISWV